MTDIEAVLRIIRDRADQLGALAEAYGPSAENDRDRCARYEDQRDALLAVRTDISAAVVPASASGRRTDDADGCAEDVRTLLITDVMGTRSARILPEGTWRGEIAALTKEHAALLASGEIRFQVETVVVGPDLDGAPPARSGSVDVRHLLVCADDGPMTVTVHGSWAAMQDHRLADEPDQPYERFDGLVAEEHTEALLLVPARPRAMPGSEIGTTRIPGGNEPCRRT